MKYLSVETLEIEQGEALKQFTPAECYVICRKRKAKLKKLVEITLLDLIFKKVLTFTTERIQNHPRDPFRQVVQISAGPELMNYDFQPHEYVFALPFFSNPDSKMFLKHFLLLALHRIQFRGRFIFAYILESRRMNEHFNMNFFFRKLGILKYEEEGVTSKIQIEKEIRMLEDSIPELMENEPEKAQELLQQIQGNIILLEHFELDSLDKLQEQVKPKSKHHHTDFISNFQNHFSTNYEEIKHGDGEFGRRSLFDTFRFMVWSIGEKLKNSKGRWDLFLGMSFTLFGLLMTLGIGGMALHGFIDGTRSSTGFVDYNTAGKFVDREDIPVFIPKEASDKYKKIMREFKTEEAQALDIWDNSIKGDYISLKNLTHKGMRNWTDCIDLLNELKNLRLDRKLKEQNDRLIQYCYANKMLYKYMYNAAIQKEHYFKDEIQYNNNFISKLIKQQEEFNQTNTLVWLE